MKRVGFFALIATLSLAYADTTFGGSILANFFSYLLHVSLWYISLLKPLRDSYAPPTTLITESSNASPEGLRTLTQVLQSVPGRRAFEKHVRFVLSVVGFVRLCFVQRPWP